MRKLMIYILALVLICFLIPILFTTGRKEQTVAKEITENEVVSETVTTDYEYREYNIVRLLHTETNEIEEVNLDEYLYHVVSAEMPANFEMEALKAQAVVARTYTIYKIKHKNHDNADICDSHLCCQAWISKEDRLSKWDENERESNWNKIVACVNVTKGKIITYQGEPINAFFHSNSGGMTEMPVNVWGGTGYPYLQAVETSGEDAYTQYASELEIIKQELVDKIKEKHADISIDWSVEKPIEILEYTDGNRVKTIRFGNLNLSGVEVRTLLGLRSANFTFEIIGDSVKFSVKGYGHGVGMSQTGADSLAKQGKNYEEIIKHYYTGVEIVNFTGS